MPEQVPRGLAISISQYHEWGTQRKVTMHFYWLLNFYQFVIQNAATGALTLSIVARSPGGPAVLPKSLYPIRHLAVLIDLTSFSRRLAEVIAEENK